MPQHTASHIFACSITFHGSALPRTKGELLSHLLSHQPLLSLALYSNHTDFFFPNMAALGLSCSTWDLHCVPWDPPLWGTDSLVASHRLSSCSERA